MKTFLIVMLLTGNPTTKAFEFDNAPACQAAIERATMPKGAAVLMFCAPTQESTLLAPTRNRNGTT